MAGQQDPGQATHRDSTLAGRLATEIGTEIHDARRRRGWSLRELGGRAGLTGAAIHRLESGQSGSLTSYPRIAVALNLRPELHLVDERRNAVPWAEDPVHAWMGDVETVRLQSLAFSVAIDEPYQHYQFAGRGDVIAWTSDRRALLHIENRTRFPNLQDAAGSYNAKRAYLAAAIADRLRVRGGGPC